MEKRIPMTFQEFLLASMTGWKSKHFTPAELIRCDSAMVSQLDNMPTRAEFGMLADLAVELDKVRELWEGPILIQPDGSGFRDPVVNGKAGGEASSDHQCLIGAAADIHPIDRGESNIKRLFKLIWINRKSDDGTLRFDQIILYPERIHFGWRPMASRYEARRFLLDGPEGHWPIISAAEIALFPGRV